MTMSPSQLRVMLNLLCGFGAGNHLFGSPPSPNLEQTILSIHTRGWITWHPATLTERGREALARHLLGGAATAGLARKRLPIAP